MHHAFAKHTHDFIQQGLMQLKCKRFGHFNIVEPRCGIAVGILHEIHQQHAVSADVGGRHTNTRIGQSKQGIDFSCLPKLFLHFAAVAAAFLHCALLAAVLHLAALHIGCGLAKASLLDVFIDLGTANMLTATDDVDRGFFAAHELGQDLVDEAFF